MILAAKAAVAATGEVPYRWVVVGASGNLFTSDSTTASSWTSRTSSFSSDNINCVATNGAGFYVAVGAQGKLATSPDGITWTQRTSSFGTTEILFVAYGNGYWVATGVGGTLATATDPTGTWTQRTSGTANNIDRVVYGGEWVFGAQSGVIHSTTANPTTGWTARTSTLTGDVKTIGYNKTVDLYLAGTDAGTTGALASSPDGTTWTARASADSLTLGSGGYSVSTASVIVLAVGAFIQTSTNGTTWTARTEANAGIMFGVAVDNNGLFAVVSGTGGNPKIQTSSDGTTWTDRGNVSTGWLPSSICHSFGYPNL